MSLMSGRDNALTCVSHLLTYEVSPVSMHSVAALLSQECGESVSAYTHSGGYWTFDCVSRLLYERGMKCTVVLKDGVFKSDSLAFLQKHPGLVGFIDTSTLESFRYHCRVWSTSSCNLSVEEVRSRFSNAVEMVMVHKMWQPLLSFYKRNVSFHISADETPLKRDECSPTSCWRPEPVSYEGRERAVKEQLRATKQSPILMSSRQEIMLCHPGARGWRTETLLNFDSMLMPQEEKPRVVAERLAEKLVERIETGDKPHGWSIMAHALFSAYNYLGGRMKPREFSSLSKEDQQTLEEYEANLRKICRT